MHSSVPDEYSYSHLLGLYLGDARADADASRLVLRFDAARRDVVHDAETSIRLVALDEAVVGRRRQGRNVEVVECTWPRWPAVLPGAGHRDLPEERAHLAPWQHEVLEREPEAFLRGLVAAGGCRVVNRFTTKLPSGRVAEYAYPRYFFSSTSPELRSLFGAACERIGVRWTQSNARNVSVAHRDGVALLDSFIDPKA